MRQSPGRSRLAHALVVAFAALLGTACGEGSTLPGPAVPPPPPPAEVPLAPPMPALILSNPSASATGGVGSLATVETVYLSLRPGTAPRGTRIEFTNRRTRVSIGGVLVDGGLDPVALAATVGDTIGIAVTGGDLTATARYAAVVPASRAPVIVRTEPVPGTDDVPPSAALLVVASEPIDPVTAAAGGARLTRNGVAVPGTVTAGDSPQPWFTFTPTEPLAPHADYLLSMNTAITDRDGEALERSVAIDFRTGAGPVPDPEPEPDPDPEPGATGTLVVTLGITGTNLDPTVDVILCGLDLWDCPRFHEAVDVSTTGTFRVDLPVGIYTYWFANLAPNCQPIISSAPSIEAGMVTTLHVDFYCAPDANVVVTVQAIGEDIPERFRVRVGGGAFQSLAPNTPVTLSSFEGIRVVQLEPLPGNCTLVGPSTVTLELTASQPQLVEFVVVCARLPRLEVTITATGANFPAEFFYQLNPDIGDVSYYIHIPLAPNATATHTVLPGQHWLTLSNLPSNCHATSPASVSIHAPPAAVLPVQFSVHCQ